MPPHEVKKLEELIIKMQTTVARINQQREEFGAKRKAREVSDDYGEGEG
jgi:hypothetical protein